MPDWSDSQQVVASVYHKGRFALYRFDVEVGQIGSAQLAELPNGAVPDAATLVRPAETQTLPVASDYRIRLGLDFVQSVVALDPDLAYGWGASLGFTDLLGNHQLFGHLSSATDDLSVQNLNVGLSYSDLGQRWSRHFGVFRIATRPTSISARPVYSEVRTGAFAGVTYPLSLFDRLELSGVARYLERDPSLQLPGEPGSSWLWSTYLAFVHDNTLWSWQGPMRGIRYNLTFGHTIDVQDRGFDRQTIQFDYRQYHELSRGVVLATRAAVRTSFGSDSQFFWLGGPNDLRGYPWFQFFGDRVLLANLELRFPLLDYIGLRFPFGPFDLPPIRGNLFNDVARVDGPIYQTGWIGSFGYSVSMTLFPPLVLRMDVVRTHDFEKTSAWDVDWNLSFLF